MRTSAGAFLLLISFLLLLPIPPFGVVAASPVDYSA